MVRKIFYVSLLALLNSFAYWPAQTAVAHPSERETEAAPSIDRSSLLAYYLQVSNYSKAEQRAEYEKVFGKDLAREIEPRNPLRAAMLLIVPGTEFQDEQHARRIVEEYLRRGESSDLDDLALANLLQRFLGEREHLRAQCRDAQQSMSHEREKRRTLETQLEQLKAVEQDVTESERSIVDPGPEVIDDDAKKSTTGR